MAQTVLVTGGAGYIGSHVCKALAQSGYQPIALDNLSRGHARAVRWGPLEVHEIADKEAVQGVLERYRVAAVIHLAAYAYVGESTAAPEIYFENNVIGTLRLLEVILSAGVKRVVFSSSCATYGAPRQLPIREDHPQQPLNPYGLTKLFVEEVLKTYGEVHGLEWVSLRYFNAAGADPDGELGEEHEPETHLIPLAIQGAIGQRSGVKIYGRDYPTPDGTPVRDYVHVADLADAHVRALAHLLRGGQSRAFNLGAGRGYSVLEVLAAVAQVCGRPVPVVEAPRRLGDSPILVADATYAKSVLGWQPRRSDLGTILKSALDWERKRNSEAEPFIPAHRAACGAMTSALCQPTRARHPRRHRSKVILTPNKRGAR
jgi:UDP-arabinose 4-epimerase